MYKTIIQIVLRKQHYFEQKITFFNPLFHLPSDIVPRSSYKNDILSIIEMCLRNLRDPIIRWLINNKTYKRGSTWRFKELIAFTLILSMLSGCATIFKGSNAEVRFNSTPSNATIKINGVDRGSTPASLDLKRNSSYMVAFSKDGYEDVNFEISRSFDGATVILGNLVSWWLLGVVVDVASGAAYTLSPADLQGNLNELREAGLIDDGKVDENSIHVMMITKEQWVEISE